MHNFTIASRNIWTFLRNVPTVSRNISVLRNILGRIRNIALVSRNVTHFYSLHTPQKTPLAVVGSGVLIVILPMAYPCIAVDIRLVW